MEDFSLIASGDNRHDGFSQIMGWTVSDGMVFLRIRDCSY